VASARDGVLAYFGYPQAHEHDAERAVRAGLAVVETVRKLDTGDGVPLQVRIGIATGLMEPLLLLVDRYKLVLEVRGQNPRPGCPGLAVDGPSNTPVSRSIKPRWREGLGGFIEEGARIPHRHSSQIVEKRRPPRGPTRRCTLVRDSPSDRRTGLSTAASIVLA
jgi:hypothetical protein